MRAKHLMAIAMAGACAVAALPAHAVTHFVTLTGTTSNTTTNSFMFGNSLFNTGNLVLDPFTPFTIAEGDIIEATLTLTGGFVVPASGEQLFGLNFFRSDGADPTITANEFQTTVSGTGVFAYSLGPTGLPSDTQGGACSNCLTSIMGQAPGAAFTFDSFTLTQTIDRLGGTYEIDSASFSYQLREAISAVPEPGTWAMMIIGFGVIGSAMRTRRRSTLAVPA